MDYSKAKTISSKEDLDTFIAGLQESPSILEEAPKIIAAAAIATISFMLNTNNKKFDFGAGTVEEAIWVIMEQMISSDKLSLLQATKIRQMLHPSTGTNCIYLDPEIFKLLQQEAQAMLDTFPDATDDKKYYWKSIVRGELPSRMVIKLT